MNLVPATNEDITINHVVGFLTLGAAVGIVLARLIVGVHHRRTAGHQLFSGICCR